MQPRTDQAALTRAMRRTPLLHHAPLLACDPLTRFPVTPPHLQKWTQVAQRLAMGNCNDTTLAHYAERVLQAGTFNAKLLLPLPTNEAWEIASPYFASLSGQSWGKIMGIRSALAKATVSAGYPHPFDITQNVHVDPRWKGFFASLKQTCPSINLAKDPLPVHTVCEVVKLWLDKGTLYSARLATQLVATYLARGRYRELATASVSQFTDHGEGKGVDFSLPKEQQKHGSVDAIIPFPESTQAGLAPAPLLRAFIARVPNDGGLLFRRTQASRRGAPHDRWATGKRAAQPFSSSSFLKDLRTALASLHESWTPQQLKKIGTHSLRKGCVSQMYRAGASYINCKGWLRHKAKNAVFRYVTTDIEDQRRQLALLGHED